MIFVIYYKTITMKRKLLLLFTLLHCTFLFVSCTKIEYESSDRIVFEGYVKGQDGTPLQNIPVATNVYLDGQYGDYDKISYTKTDGDGHYLMIFPKPTNHTNISLSINNSDYYTALPEEIQNALTGYTISNILPEDLNEFEFNFGNTTLYSENDLTTLTINFVTSGPVDGNFPITGYEGLFPYTQMFYNLPDYEVDPNYLLYTANWPEPIGLNRYYYVLQQDGITYSRTFTVLKNQAFIFKYRNADNVETSVNIPIANEPVTHTINY